MKRTQEEEEIFNLIESERIETLNSMKDEQIDLRA